jgi:hypothetical protein
VNPDHQLGQNLVLRFQHSWQKRTILGGIFSGHTSPKALPGATDYSKAEYTNTQQDLPVGDNYFIHYRHERLLGHGVSFAEK